MKSRLTRSVVLAAMLLAFGNPLGGGSNLATAAPPEKDRAAIVAGNTQFALDLYARLSGEDGNLFVSPYSISTALAMTYAGARGETAQQMADVLHLPLAQERLHPALAGLEGTLEAAGNDAGCALHIANSLWGQQGYGFLEEFLALNREHYGAGFREVDFAGAPEQARRMINSWVADQTQRIIKDLLQEGDVDPADVLALVNAIYFKGSWASQFDPRQTTEGPFHIDADTQISVPMMYQAQTFPFAATADLSLVELPYDGDRLSMVLLLPRSADGLGELESKLSQENLDGWLGALRAQTVRVRLPRFKLQSRWDLAKTLQTMGMVDAFHGSRADFSGMTGRRDLFIGMVIHEARVDVNEEGTEAAAATAVKMKRGGLPPEFTADHPFLVLIRDGQTGTILFMGRVVNPAG
jgi:serpin B